MVTKLRKIVSIVSLIFLILFLGFFILEKQKNSISGHAILNNGLSDVIISENRNPSDYQNNEINLENEKGNENVNEIVENENVNVSKDQIIKGSSKIKRGSGSGGNYNSGNNNPGSSNHGSIIEKKKINNLKNGLKLDVNGSNEIEFNKGSRIKPRLMKNNSIISEFELSLDSDVDLSSVEADSDLNIKKAFVHMSKGIAENLVLYVPRDSRSNAVVICENASSLSEIYKGCKQNPRITKEYVLKIGDPLLKLSSDGKYFIVSKINGTGGEAIYINATNAEHLDSEKHFISDIFNLIKYKDNVWSNAINNNEYVRVIFEQNLTSNNDITVRAFSAGSSLLFYDDNENYIGEMSISVENDYRFNLTNLTGNEDTFFIRINGSSVYFDWIIDPSGANITEIKNETGVSTPPGNISAIAGNLSEVGLSGDSVTGSWQGYFGNVSGSLILEDANGNNFYNWSVLSPLGEVYVSRNSSLNFNLIKCANFSEILLEEVFIGQQSFDMDSVSRTFNGFSHPEFFVANKKIDSNTCNSTNLYRASGARNNFYEVLLSDGDDIIYTALLERDLEGFDVKTHDFEMIVGENGHDGNTSPTIYYFYMEIN